MLRRATPECLQRLLDAATATDLELDLALLRIGILSPLDLAPIRDWLIRPAIRLRALVNADGHRVVAVIVGDEPAAWIQPDGEVIGTAAQPDGQTRQVA